MKICCKCAFDAEANESDNFQHNSWFSLSLSLSLRNNWIPMKLKSKVKSVCCVERVNNFSSFHLCDWYKTLFFGKICNYVDIFNVSLSSIRAIVWTHIVPNGLNFVVIDVASKENLVAICTVVSWAEITAKPLIDLVVKLHVFLVLLSSTPHFTSVIFGKRKMLFLLSQVIRHLKRFSYLVLHIYSFTRSAHYSRNLNAQFLNCSNIFHA